MKESHSAGYRPALNTDFARSGAQRLAAAVVLTGNAEINVPDSKHHKKGIDADTILYDWDRGDVKKLLESGVFNDILYSAVRFRHRDIRELLAAEFFSSLIKGNYNRLQIESYFFRDPFGVHIITPLLRPVLSWLILFDDNICAKTLNITPEIIIEGGDPSKLAMHVRKKAILKLIDSIDKDRYKAYIGSDTAIANLAQPDLESDVLELINGYKNNDNIILFLSRLVLQGALSNCVSALIPVIIDNNRDKYTRRIAANAVMSIGTQEQKNTVWQGIHDSNVEIPRWLLADLVLYAESTISNVDFIIHSVVNLSEPNEFMPTALSEAVSGFIEHANSDVTAYLLNKLHSHLRIKILNETERDEVSKQDTWLMSVALKCMERLTLARNQYALSNTSLSVLARAAELSFYQEMRFDACETNLQHILPQWTELNDALYWYSIEDARKRLNSADQPLNSDLPLFYRDNYWRFETSDFSRMLAYIGSRTLDDDKLVALGNAYRIYHQSDCPINMLDDLRKAVSGNSVLEDKLERLLNPEISETMKKYEEESKIRSEKFKRIQEDQEKSKKKWIAHLRNNPSEVVTPSAGEGEITNSHVWLLDEIRKNSLDASCPYCTNWKSLIPEFGNKVALAYKDFCMNYWRCYKPSLKSEQDFDNSIPNSLLIALTGLEIEANEISDFPNYLDNNDLNTALRYITWNINGFPSWFERVHRAFPQATEETVLKELIWELETCSSKDSLSYILQDLVHHAPWLHEVIASRILDYLMSRISPLTIHKEYCVKILIEGGIESSNLATLANNYIELSQDSHKEVAWWFALLVDNDADSGIPRLEGWLSLLNEEAAQQTAAIFITALLGGTYTQKTVYYAGKFKTASHLKTLYMLMYEYIKPSDDIQRAGKGVYSPTIRDDAQDARDRLLNYLVEIPSKANYYALKQISEEYKYGSHKLLVQRRAYEMAERCGNLTPWSAEQFKEFHKSKVLSPRTHRQLFELAVKQLKVLKDWVENGNDSPWLTWQKATEENEVRTLIAGYLNQHRGGHYTIAEEPELANEQRMDIWLANPKIQSPVPIELKLLDKNWSGSKLCERLRNQLVGDYLREETAGCGVFLLVSLNQTKCWKIGDETVSIDELASALKRYWQTISDQYKGVEEIEVIVIDLQKRELVSNT